MKRAQIQLTLSAAQVREAIETYARTMIDPQAYDVSLNEGVAFCTITATRKRGPRKAKQPKVAPVKAAA